MKTSYSFNPSPADIIDLTIDSDEECTQPSSEVKKANKSGLSSFGQAKKKVAEGTAKLEELERLLKIKELERIKHLAEEELEKMKTDRAT